MNQSDDWNCYYTTCSVCGARYHRSELGCCDDEGEEEMEEARVPVGKILVTARLIVSLIRYGLLPGEWRSTYQREKKGKLKKHQMAHVKREDFQALADALQPIIDGERKLEHNQLKYVHEVYAILAKEL